MAKIGVALFMLSLLAIFCLTGCASYNATVERWNEALGPAEPITTTYIDQHVHCTDFVGRWGVQRQCAPTGETTVTTVTYH